MNRTLNLFRTRTAACVHDLLMVSIAWLGAYWLRFNLDSIPDEFWIQALALLPIVLVAQGSMFWYFGLYRALWRFASVPDLIQILKAVAAGMAITAAASFILTRFEFIPRSVFILDGILLLLLLGGPRFAYRWVKERHLYANGKRALIVGAGKAGEMLACDLLRDALGPYRPVAFVDDDPAKACKAIQSSQVVGSCDEIPNVVVKHGIDFILIALPSATSRQLRRIVSLCETTNLPFRTLPIMDDLVNGDVSYRNLREVKIDDLLGREPIKLDWPAISLGNKGKTILVTGGGGSIGAELCCQIAKVKPARLIVLDRSEFNLSAIELQLRHDFPELTFIGLLVDVCDEHAVENTLRTYRPQVIFHAAAYKYVPLLEGHIRSAVVNNIFGTKVLATLADKYACESFVLVSTDKAVNPRNIMGMTKRVAELYCQNLNSQSQTQFITVRFGNVLGSSGSVVMVFQQQIALGGPVTVTHPEVTRYFMTIPEACQLILQASVIGKEGGEIFVLDMGEPIKISYLAEQMIKLSGKKPGEDIEIIYTGLRPGEKLHEELFHDAEKMIGTSHPKILFAYCRQVYEEVLEPMLNNLIKACDTADEEELMKLLLELVPEHSNSTASATNGNRETVIYPWKNTMQLRSDA